MTPREHLPDDWIVAYAAGTLSPAEAVVAATHLTLCPTCRHADDLARAAAASELARGPEVALDAASVDELMGRLDDADDDEPPPQGSDPVLPWPVLRLCGPIADLRWRWLAPYTSGVDLPVPTSGLPLRLVRMRAGARMPHRHTGREVGVVLQGGWTDQWGHHERGDVALNEDLEHVHEQVIDPGVDCVTLVLNDAPAIPAIPFGKLLSTWLRI